MNYYPFKSTIQKYIFFQIHYLKNNQLHRKEINSPSLLINYPLSQESQILPVQLPTRRVRSPRRDTSYSVPSATENRPRPLVPRVVSGALLCIWRRDLFIASAAWSWLLGPLGRSPALPAPSESAAKRWAERVIESRR